jgi:hypothetical protein
MKFDIVRLVYALPKRAPSVGELIDVVWVNCPNRFRRDKYNQAINLIQTRRLLQAYPYSYLIDSFLNPPFTSSSNASFIAASAKIV